MPEVPCTENNPLTRPLITESMPIRNPYANMLLPTAPLSIISYLESVTEVNETVNDFHSGDIHGAQNPVDDGFAHKEFTDNSEESNSNLSELSPDDDGSNHSIPIDDNEESDSGLLEPSPDDDGSSHSIPTPARLSHESDDLVRWQSGPTDKFTPLALIVPRRERKQELLPYSMVPINEEDRQCDLCGSSFKEIPWNQFQDLSICT